MPEDQPKLDDEFLLSHAHARYENAKNLRTEEIEPRWEKDNDLYNSKFSPKEIEASKTLLGQGRLFIPKTYTNLQRMLIDLLDVYFFDKEEMVSVSSWKNLPSEISQLVKTLLNYRLNNHPIQFYEEAYEACQDALRNKIGIFKVYPILTTDKSGKITGFHPQVECVPYEDVFFSSDSTWKNYWSKDVVHRKKVSYDYLKQRGSYKNLDKIDYHLTTTSTDTIKTQREEDQGSPFADTSKIQIDKDNIYIYEFWTHLDVDKDGLLESATYTCAGDENGFAWVISELKENTLPYKWPGEDYVRPPIVVGTSSPESHKMYGKSRPEVWEGLQRETNAIRNQRREEVARRLRTPTLVRRGSNINLQSLMNRRIGATILGDDIGPDSVREMESRPVGNDSALDEQRNDQNFAEASSISPPSIGVPTTKEQTAFETSRLDANSNKAIAQVIRNMAHTLFLPSFNMLLRLEQAYESDEFIAMVTGKKLGWNFPDDGVPPWLFIQGDFELNVDIGATKSSQLQLLFTAMDKGNLVNQTTAQMVQLGVIQPQDAKFINQTYIFERALPLMKEKNPEEFFIQAQPPTPQEGQGQVGGVASQPALPGNVGNEFL